MSTFKKFLAESVDISKLEFTNLPVKMKIDDFNKPSPYDWFIELKVQQEFGTAIGRAYDKWIKENQPAHPCGFMAHWLVVMATPKLTKNHRENTNLYNSHDAYKDLFKYITEEVIINGSTIRVLSDFEMWRYDDPENLKILPPPPKLHMVSGYIDISNCSFNSLPAWLPEVIGGSLRVRNCKNLTSISHIHNTIHSCKKIDFVGSPIKSSVLGLLKIEDLKFVKFDVKISAVDNIINRHLNQSPVGNKRVMEAQSELLDAGLDEFAQL